jgi:hypothetical protein
LVGVRLGEDGELARCFIKTGQLEPGVAGHVIGFLAAEYAGVACLEICAYGHTPSGIVYRDKPPWLTQPH